MATAGTLCLLSIGVAASAPGQPPGSAAAGASAGAAPRPGTVAVAPFTNLSGDPSDAWIGDGLVETVTTDLERLAPLTVVTRAAFAAEPQAGTGHGAPDDAAALAVARRLGAAWVVTGGYARRGPRLSVTARIVSVAVGTARRTVRVDGELGALFELQDELGAALRAGFAELVGTRVAERRGGRVAGLALDPTGAPPPAAAPGPPRRGGGVLGARATGRAALPDFAGPSDVPPPAAAQAPAAPVPFAPGRPRRPDGLAAADLLGGTVVEDDLLPRFGVASGAGVLTGRPAVRPPRTRVAPDIDGRLDDAVWADAARITDFVQLSPLDGAPGTEASEAYIAYDSANIYLAFRARYTDPGMLRANLSDRDEVPGDDAFVVYFDPFLDQQRAYVFSVNGYGVQTDAILSSREGGGGGFGGGGAFGNRRREPRGFFGPPRGDRSWDTLFDTAGQVVADGFTAEMAIPFKSLRYPQRTGNAVHRWGFQIARRLRGKNETQVWAPVSRNVAGFLPQMGVLEGMTRLSTSRNIEMLPTFTALRFGGLDAAGDFGDGDLQPEGGVNFKYGVTSNLTADVTFNPDFSQIESDRPQIEVNQRFALFYPELRPFFLEGAEIFQFQSPFDPVTLVHTRTIVDPQYGAKLTGKAGDTTIGVMYANDEAAPDIEDAGTAGLGHTSQTFVGRLRYDLYAESHIGGIFTDRQFLDGYNRVGGLDGNFRLGDTHTLGVRAIGSRDRDLDGLETSGYLLDASLDKIGRNLSYTLAHYALSPDFRTDVGFVRRTDQRATFGTMLYRWWPEHWLISWGPSLDYMRGHNFAGVLEDQQVRGGLNFSFANNVRFDANVSREMERFGGIDFFKTRYSYMGVISASRAYSFGVGADGGNQIFFDPDNPYLGRDRGWNIFFNLRAFPRWQSRVFVNTNRFVDARRTGRETLVFDVNIFRAQTTYQFTDRLLFRNISEFNSFDQKLSLNFLFTYRVNAGTVFYVGYDDHYRQADLIERDVDGDGLDDRFFPGTALKRTNRAIFTKLQYLFRY